MATALVTGAFGVRRFLLGLGENVSSLGTTIAAVCLIAIVVINGANVVARYAYGSAFSWAEETMVFIMIAGVFWGAVAVAWRQMEIRIDAFVARASGRIQLGLRVIATLISIAILCWLGFVGARFTYQIYAFELRSPALNLPMWIPHSAFASGLFLVILMMVARLFAPARAQPPDQTQDQLSNKGG